MIFSILSKSKSFPFLVNQFLSTETDLPDRVSFSLTSCSVVPSIPLVLRTDVAVVDSISVSPLCVTSVEQVAGVVEVSLIVVGSSPV